MEHKMVQSTTNDLYFVLGENTGRLPAPDSKELKTIYVRNLKN